MAKKKKSSKKTLWSRIRSNPDAIGEIFGGVGDVVGAFKGKSKIKSKGEQKISAPEKMDWTSGLFEAFSKRKKISK
mgnify:CR=1 FL=1